MASNFLKIRNGITLSPQAGTAVTTQGDVDYNSSDNKIEVFTTQVENVATDKNILTLSNKTLQQLVGVAITDSATTGSNQTLPSGDIAGVTVRLTNGTLSSIAGITAGTSGQQLIVENQTGVSVTIFDNSLVASAANRIRTGTAGAVTMLANASFLFQYDGTTSLWMLVGGTGSGSGSGTGDDLDALNYSVSFTDTFSDATQSTTSVNSTGGNTNATYNGGVPPYFTLSYDASKTVTGTGTAMTISATPAYTVVAGDMLRVGTQARKITVVTTQTSYTIESAFTTNPATAACTISQAVITKDINNFAVDGVAPSAIFTGSISSFILIYNDTSSGTLYNYTDPALVAYTASADGTNFTTVSVREANPSVEALANSTPTAGSNLYFRFFSDASSGSGTVNLIGYKAFFQSENAVESGGVLNQAYAFTNGVGTPYNCTVSGGNGSATVLNLTWNYPVGLNVGGPDGSIQVYLNGQKIPRFINSTLTPDASYLEISGTAIQLDRDYSSQNLNVEVVQQVFVVDSSTQNTTNIASVTSFISNSYEVDRIFSTGTGATFRPDYMFFTASCNATAGATYTNNAITFTVYQTVAGSALVIMNGSGTPQTSGILTKASGTGDSTITFSSWKLPTWIRAKVQGPGGNGGATAATGASAASVGGGGGGGGYAEKLIYGSLLSTSYLYTVGTPGGNSTFVGGSVSLTGNGGGTGAAGAAETGGPIYASGGAVGGSASGGDVNSVGQFGWPGIVLNTGQYLSGLGGSSRLGFAINANQGGTGPGSAGSSPGVGGSGASAAASQGAQSGGAGANGLIILEQHYVGG